MQNPTRIEQVASIIRTRHLNAEEARALIADLLMRTPEKSDRQIGRMAGADHKTVGVVREGLENGGEIPHHDERVGADGVKQPATAGPRNRAGSTRPAPA